jgi:hypothetical protein
MLGLLAACSLPSTLMCVPSVCVAARARERVAQERVRRMEEDLRNKEQEMRESEENLVRH